MEHHGILGVALKRGLVVILALAVLTVIEYFTPIAFERGLSVPLLTVIALGKASLIIYYFMHIYQLWHAEE